MVTRKEVFEKLKANPKFPTPSELALKILDLCRREDTSLSEIADVIQGDPALSAEVLKFANSAFLATGIKVASIQKATVKLGMNTVVHLALGFSLLSANKNGGCSEFNYHGFWSLSLAQAVAARTIASFTKYFKPDEMFVCGLLAHIGELALASMYPNEYGTILFDQPAKEERKNLEKGLFFIDSDELTTELFLDWGLPDVYAYAAGFHEDLHKVTLDETTTRRVAELLYVSRKIAELCIDCTFRRELLDTLETQLMGLDTISEDFGTIFDSIVTDWQGWGESFNIRTKKCPRYEEIRARCKADE